jgi:cell wall-associated NlpC family hydrolase
MLRGVHLIIRQGLVLIASIFSIPAWSDAGVADRERPLIHALQTLGVQYRYGGRSPESGFDCSGLITHVFERAWGVLLPPGTAALSKVGTAVKLKALEPGDLVFYNTRNRPFSHVGIYLGDGRFLHAPRSGAVVRVESVETRYWRTRFSGARRLEPPTF